jgi:hypothetical protein
MWDAGISAAYDYNDELHVIFQKRVSKDVQGPVLLHHWRAATGVNTVAEAYWDLPGLPAQQENINHPQLAVGSGSRLNNLYLVWDQYGDAETGADTSAAGLLNAGIFLAISTDGGMTWDHGRNLVDTPSPGCAGNCRSQVFPFIAPVVDSLTHILFVQDLEAGFSSSAVTENPVYYMRLQTPDPDTVPIMINLPNRIGPELLGTGWIDTVIVGIRNAGTGNLEFTLSDTMPWLAFGDFPDSFSTVLAPGAVAEIPIVFDANGLGDGMYTGIVSVRANDAFVDGSEVPAEIIVSSALIQSFQFDTWAGTDCWGWEGPDGTEYAIMGVKDGVAFVNTLTLQAIQVVPGPGPCGSTWRDIKTYGRYCYAVSECGGTNEGMMIIDLQYLPDSVHYLGSYTTASEVTSHNLSIDTARGFAYLVNSALTGFRVVSLSDPESPLEFPQVTTGDLHDVYARNDTVWAAEGTEGSVSIWDMDNKNSPELIVRVAIPDAGYVHTECGWAICSHNGRNSRENRQDLGHAGPWQHSVGRSIHRTKSDCPQRARRRQLHIPCTLRLRCTHRRLLNPL